MRPKPAVYDANADVDYDLQCNIMKLVEKIIEGMNKTVEKRFPLHYDLDTVLKEQTDTRILSAVRKIRTELDMDYSELLDRLQRLE